MDKIEDEKEDLELEFTMPRFERRIVTTREKAAKHDLARKEYDFKRACTASD